ncbi:MAG: hypothetical protein ACPGVH_05730 [Chitinophagales bacterium]
MKISASIYSAKNHDLVSLLKELDELNIDFLHIDCFDKDFEKVKADLKIIRANSNTKLDFHAITKDAKRYIALAEEFKIEKMTFQLENLENELPNIENRSFELGLAIVSDTPIEHFEQYKSDIDFILLMTTEPGVSGSKFQRKNFNRIRKARKIFPNLNIHVDGGINAEVSFILRMLGVYSAVSGSFLVNHKNLASALIDLRFAHTGSEVLVKEYQIAPKELPILDAEKTNFKEIITTLEDYKLGFVFFEKQGKFYGVCSNADLRKGIINHLNNLNDINVEELINSKPFSISENISTSEMISAIKTKNFPILFLPVLADDKTISGALTFNQLIKGEA